MLANRFPILYSSLHWRPKEHEEKAVRAVTSHLSHILGMDQELEVVQATIVTQRKQETCTIRIGGKAKIQPLGARDKAGRVLRLLDIRKK